MRSQPSSDSSPLPLLLVDDDRAYRQVYRNLLTQEGYAVTEAVDRGSVLQALRAHAFAVVVLDLMLPPDATVAGGLAQLRDVLSIQPQAKVIVVSGAGDVAHMVRAVRAGAYDFLTKPVDPDVLLIVARRARTRYQLERQIALLQDSLTRTAPGGAMIGQSPAFTKAVQVAERVATSNLPVLITGESGTDKELMARAIHAASPRAAKPWVAVNCGAVPDTLFEATVFGHIKGAFTGAVRDQKGLFVQAHDGTLFLDEVGDLALPMQVKLLRALESGEIVPVGAQAPVHVDVRLVSATNRNVAELRETGALRDDLYWRICGVEVHLPALRDGPSDIALLAAFFLQQCAALAGDGRPRRLSREAEAALVEHDWPGNLRELRHEMQRATVFAGDRSMLQPDDFAFASPRTRTSPAEAPQGLQDKLDALERRELEMALTRFHGNRTRTAEALGLSRQGLLNKLNRFGLA